MLTYDQKHLNFHNRIHVVKVGTFWLGPIEIKEGICAMNKNNKTFKFMLYMGWDLVEWLERCASIPMITSANPSSGSEFTFRSVLLLTARGGSA
jgi:hypothetical protein